MRETERRILARSQAFRESNALRYRMCHRAQEGTAVLKATALTLRNEPNEGSLAFHSNKAVEEYLARAGRTDSSTKPCPREGAGGS